MAQEQNFKQYLGWGLVGTPAGRQYTNNGIDKQFNLGKTAFELGQDLGGCLPSPKLGDDAPLYALISRTEQNVSLLGFAEYFSIYEQGQTRAGTYFGSFIETANASFSPNSIKDIFSGLRQLSIYQMTHFIDNEKKAYHTSITGKTFESPKALEKIQLVAPVKNSITKTASSDFLFIHCQEGEALKVAEYLITSGLHYQYKDIFFTESEHISAQVRQMKRLQISSSQLFSLDIFVSSYKSEIHYLHTYIQELSKKYQDATSEIQQLKSEQAKIIQQEVTKKVEVQARAYQQERDNAIAEMKKVRAKAELGDTRLSLFSNEVAKQVAEKTEQKLTLQLDNKFKSLELKLCQPVEPVQAVQVDDISNPSMATKVLAIICALLFLMLVFTFAWQWFDSSVKISEQEYHALQADQKRVEDMEKKITELEQEKQQLKNARETAIKEQQDFSKAYNADLSKNDTEHNKGNKKSAGGKNAKPQ